MQELLESIAGRLTGLDVSRAISPDDMMMRPGGEQYYFAIGRSALLNVASALLARRGYLDGSGDVRKILDFGCGHGRVARYLRAAFPNAVIDACDRNKPGVRWCAQHFNCTPVAEETAFSGSYDLIWLGSVFTHLPEDVAVGLLSNLKRAVAPSGVLMFSTQGRYSAAAASEKGAPGGGNYALSDESLRILLDSYQAGYGFVSYPRTPGYGVSIVPPDWYSRHVMDENFVQLLSAERGWDHHQDVHAFMRYSLVERRRPEFLREQMPAAA